VCECDHESSIMRRPWSTRAVAHGKNILVVRKVTSGLSRDIITTRLKKIKAKYHPPIPMIPRLKTCVCGRLLAGIVGSNPAWDMDVCLLLVLCVVR